ncbi:hypothetical protein [Flavobacterium hercynium]|uniref:Uncharacterized protein n=1 Tax=Flavobacterium hercynium TaxID=387094 RepID=A0A226HFI4_9FLAO|nr:hypothetical protein [Flavobacterium hercynium]OXA93109.1 hypothetical protein B0A66_07480 [Flavobacterium hercynium]SMP32511.1 hypothetical protein SAMN06265346_11540 [Flavobacterium hercynium]
MTVESFLEELQNNKPLSIATIDFIEDDEEIGKKLVVHFKNNPNRALALQFIQNLTAIRTQPYSNECEVSANSLMLASYILGLHKNVEDCLKIWEAKTIDFDTYCGLDIQLTVFAGVEETINFLKNQTDDISKKALEYIEICKSSGDFDYLEEYFSEDQIPWFI